MHFLDTVLYLLTGFPLFILDKTSALTLHFPVIFSNKWMNAFLFSMIFIVCWFFQNKPFQKLLSEIPSECQTNWIQIRPTFHRAWSGSKPSAMVFSRWHHRQRVKQHAQSHSFFSTSATCFSLILTLLLQSPIELTSLRHQLHIAPRFLICFPKKKIELGQKAIKNALFCQYLSDILFHCIVCVISMLLLISGDVHPNPGPNVSLDTSASSSCSDIPGMSVLRDHLNIVHLNIQSLYPKRDILQVEMQYYDIVVLTETWLSPNKKRRI